ncbi:MAG TPA: hypothetical protein VM934_09650 [Pyrinomonadaceae bacterium]|jgi:hypothetical protein|nr:hypothetical protein [Pyrinomonadaceae bacterium]
MRAHLKHAAFAVTSLVVLAVAFVATKSGTTVRATKSPLQETADVVNKTKSLEVLDSRIVQVGEHCFVEFKVKNSGRKSVAIVAFDRYKGSERQVDFQRLSWLTENIETPLLAPGQTSSPTLVDLDGAQAHIAAVIFEDGTGEGDPAIFRRLREQFGYYKDGMRLARARVRALLAQVERGEKSSDATMEELQAELTKLGARTDQPMMASNGYLAAAAALRKAAKKGRGLTQLREAASDIEKAAQ